MKQRAIILIPEVRRVELIDNIREKYDPFVQKVPPHITLVFPFWSNFSTHELENWIKKVLHNMNAFELELGGISMASNTFENYLFLNILKGKEELTRLNEILYDGLLKQFKRNLPYIPHMTVGKLQNKSTLDEAYEEVKKMEQTFSTIIDTVYIEEIDEEQMHHIEIAYSLAR